MEPYLITDLIFKIRYKVYDYLLRVYWKMLLGKLGKGSYIRTRVRILGNPKRLRIGNKFKIYENCIIAIGKAEIEIGDNGFIGVGTYINASFGKIKIGNGVAIAPFCKLFTYSHHYSEDKGIRESFYSKDIVIGNDVLIGSNSVILPGVTIGNSSIIAAGSVVIRDVESNTIVGGIPAKMIKSRITKSAK